MSEVQGSQAACSFSTRHHHPNTQVQSPSCRPVACRPSPTLSLWARVTLHCDLLYSSTRWMEAVFLKNIEGSTYMNVFLLSRLLVLTCWPWSPQTRKPSSCPPCGMTCASNSTHPICPNHSSHPQSNNMVERVHRPTTDGLRAREGGGVVRHGSSTFRGYSWDCVLPPRRTA